MKRMKLFAALALSSAICAGLGLVGCENVPASGGALSLEEVYSSAQQLGFSGTYEEFVSLLSSGDVGKDGADGKDGVDGKNGADGKDGTNGVDGKNGADGKDGTNGVDGKDGKDGVDGKDGIGVYSVHIDENGHLIITLTSGEEIDAGMIPGNDVSDDVPEGCTKGLSYVENGSGNGYLVRGAGSSVEVNIVIPETYRDLPVTGIGKGAFEGDEYIRSVKLPASVRSIEARAFCGCKKLRTVELGDEVTYFGDSAFEGCEMLSSEMKIPENVQYLGAHAFDGCKNMTGTVRLPKTCEKIEDGVFSGCAKLGGTLTLPDTVRYIGEAAFSGCKIEGPLTLPEKIYSIDAAAFKGVNFTGELLLPGSLGMLGEAAFAFTGFTSVKVESEVYELPGQLFDSCRKLKTVELNAENGIIGEKAFFLCDALETVEWPSRGENVLAINQKILTSAFEDCSKLAKIDFPRGLVFIGERAFMRCKMLQLEEIPKSVKELGEMCFVSCDIQKIKIYNVEVIPRAAFVGVKEITLGSGVKRIQKYAFPGGQLEKLTFEDPNGWHVIEEDKVREIVVTDPDENAKNYKLAFNLEFFKG